MYQSYLFAQLDTIYGPKLQIRKSFENIIDKGKPASLSFMIPVGAGNYYSINGAVALELTGLAENSVTTFDAFAVYNRNNKIKKEQNQYKLGLAVDNVHRCNSNLKFSTTLSAEYVNNVKDTTQSIASQLYLDPRFALKKFFRIGLPVSDFHNKRIIPLLNLIPGLEYKYSYKASQDDHTGSIARFYFSPSISIYYRVREKYKDEKSPFANLFGASFRYTFRKDFYNSTKIAEGYLPLYNFSLAYYPLKQDTFSLEAAYLFGSDPVNDLEKQEYWEFTIKIKK